MFFLRFQNLEQQQTLQAAKFLVHLLQVLHQDLLQF